jgi:hypothetical protein
VDIRAAERVRLVEGTSGPTSVYSPMPHAGNCVSNAAGVEGTPSGQLYADMLEDHPFYVRIMRLTELGVMSGYPCGGENEPCNDQNRPYFRPVNFVTRGQAVK